MGWLGLISQWAGKMNVWSMWMSKEDEWDDCDLCESAESMNGDDCMISFNEQRWWMGWLGVIREWAEKMNVMNVWSLWMGREDEWDDCGCGQWTSRRWRTGWLWVWSVNEQKMTNGMTVGVISERAEMTKEMTVDVISEWAEMLNGMTVWSVWMGREDERCDQWTSRDDEWDDCGCDQRLWMNREDEWVTARYRYRGILCAYECVKDDRIIIRLCSMLGYVWNDSVHWGEGMRGSMRLWF